MWAHVLKVSNYNTTESFTCSVTLLKENNSALSVYEVKVMFLRCNPSKWNEFYDRFKTESRIYGDRVLAVLWSKVQKINLYINI